MFMKYFVRLKEFFQDLFTLLTWLVPLDGWEKAF